MEMKPLLQKKGKIANLFYFIKNFLKKLKLFEIYYLRNQKLQNIYKLCKKFKIFTKNIFIEKSIKKYYFLEKKTIK